MQSIVGPILGIEGDQQYSVIILLDEPQDSRQLRLCIEVGSGSESQSFQPDGEMIPTATYYLYRFCFPILSPDETLEVWYTIAIDNDRIAGPCGDVRWSFVVPGRGTVPKIAFASCNGNAKLAPKHIPEGDFIMWRKMLRMHRHEDTTIDGDVAELGYAFHCLLLGGDQVYADLIWKELPYFAKRWFLSFRRSRFVINHRIPSADLPEFQRQLEEFYEKLYVDTFANKDIAAVLARIPTAMVWDDHDIVDGWGSYPSAIQNSEIFDEVFRVARKYFELFQLRTNRNHARLSSNEFSQHFKFRNFEIFLLDNRSFRTPNRIMSESQYDAIESIDESELFRNSNGELSDERVIVFLVPVPIAHLNYKTQMESLIGRLLNWQLSSGDFTKSIDDDLIDHWSHENHIVEKKRFIDTVFRMAEASNVKYAYILSGDVHSAGSGRVTLRLDNGGRRDVNQLVVSPIVYPPVGKFVQWALSKVSRQTTEVEGYQVGVDEFGVEERVPTNVYERNFGFLYKAEGRGLKFYLCLENEEQWYDWDQSRKFATDPPGVR